MTPQPKRSPAAGGLRPSAGSPSAVSPNSSRNRGPAAAKRAAGVSDRWNWRAPCSRNTRYIVGPRTRSTSCTAANWSLSVRVQSSRTSATGTSSATAKVRSRSEKRSPPPRASEPTAAPATTRRSFSARVNTRSRRASLCSTVNMTARIVNRAASQLLESGRESAVEAPASRPVRLPGCDSDGHSRSHHVEIPGSTSGARRAELGCDRLALRARRPTQGGVEACYTLQGRHIGHRAGRALDDNVDVVERHRDRTLRVGDQVSTLAGSRSAREIELAVHPYSAHRSDVWASVWV